MANPILLVELQIKLLLIARAVELGESKDVILEHIGAALDQTTSQLTSEEAAA